MCNLLPIGAPSKPLLVAAALCSAALWWTACGSRSPAERAENAAPPAAPDLPALIVEQELARPEQLNGVWQVSAGNRTCRLTLQLDDQELTGHATGCSGDPEALPVEIGLATGGSFLFQTGQDGDGWLWSGRFDSATRTLAGRRENVVTGELESFVARR